MNKLTCAVTRDLLPSYAETLTAEETNQAIEAHLASCAACRELLAVYQTPIPREDAFEDQAVAGYLKKAQRRVRLQELGLGILTVAILLVAIGSYFAFIRYNPHRYFKGVQAKLCAAIGDDSGEILPDNVTIFRDADGDPAYLYTAYSTGENFLTDNRTHQILEFAPTEEVAVREGGIYLYLGPGLWLEKEGKGFRNLYTKLYYETLEEAASQLPTH